ncbi:PREDICTED: protein FAM205A-like [Elephantulus edwardii]|uniref:protein FAM205A-like n=1 Tax=Elephantulus edwardii TaxID=28737 RepID=UPI0003F0D8CE|nr:PREDICTED: protein FAM205A-like [Elephantulus edwardii]
MTRSPAFTARRASQDDSENLRDWLSDMKSQCCPPQEQLLYAAPCCQVSSGMLLEIQQLMLGQRTLAVSTSTEESQQLLSQRSTSIVSTSAEASQNFSYLEILSLSGLPELSMLLSAKHFREPILASVTFTRLQLLEEKSLSQMAVPSKYKFSIQLYWVEHLLLGQGLQLPTTSTNPEILSLSSFGKHQQDTIYKNLIFVQGSQDERPLKFHVILLCLNIVLANDTDFMAFQKVTVFQSYLPQGNSEVLKLFEAHVKKWLQFQRWGQPRHLMGSMKHNKADLLSFAHSRYSQLISFLMNDTFNICIETTGTTYHNALGSFIITSQTALVFSSFEQPIVDTEQNRCYQNISNYLALTLPFESFRYLFSFYTRPGKQADNMKAYQTQNHSPLNCGHLCLYNETLLATCRGSQALSMNRAMSQPLLNIPSLCNVYYFFLLPNCTLFSSLYSSPCTPNWISVHVDQQMNVIAKFLMLGACETKERHLLQMQLQLGWNMLTVLQRWQYNQSITVYEGRNTVQTPETVDTPWLGKIASFLLREHAIIFYSVWMLVESKLQKDFIHHEWGLPLKSMKSVQCYADQRPLSWINTVFGNLRISQVTGPETSWFSDLFSPNSASMSFFRAHLPTQTQALWNAQIISKHWQMHLSLVFAQRCMSRDSRIPGSFKKFNEFSVKVPENKNMGVVPLGNKIDIDILGLYKTSVLRKGNFHLKGENLETWWGIPIKGRESREEATEMPENTYVQAVLGNRSKIMPISFPKQVIIRQRDPKPIHLETRLITNLKAVLLSQQRASSRALAFAHCTSKSITEERAVFALVETRVYRTSLGKQWFPESFNHRKSKGFVHVTFLTKKKEDPRKPRPVEGCGAGEEGLGLPSTRNSTNNTKDQSSPMQPLDRSSQDPCEDSDNFGLTVSHQESPQLNPVLELPPAICERINSDENFQSIQTNMNVFPKQEKIPGASLPTVPQASHAQPLLDPLIKDKQLAVQILHGDMSQEKEIIDQTLKESRPSKRAKKRKMKFFLSCISCKTVDEEAVSSSGEKKPKRKLCCFWKSLARAKGLFGKTKTEKATGDPSTQSPLRRDENPAFTEDFQVLEISSNTSYRTLFFSYNTNLSGSLPTVSRATSTPKPPKGL